jgi:hypothetical protein
LLVFIRLHRLALRLLFSCCALLLCCAPLGKCDPPQPDFPPRADGSSIGHSEIDQVLTQPVDVRFRNVRFADALLRLSRDYDLSLTFSPTASPEQLMLGRRVNLSCRHVRLGTVLTNLLDGGQLVYEIRNETLVIIPRFQAVGWHEWREYPVDDLLRAGWSLSQLGTVVKGMVFSSLDEDSPEEDDAPVIVPFESCLRIRHSAIRHQQIAELLSQIRSRGHSPSSPAETQLERILDRRVSVDFDSMPFETVLDRLREAFQVPISVDRGEAEDPALDAPNPVTIRATDISVRSLIFHVCNSLSHRLKMVVKNDELFLNPFEWPEELPNVRVYDVDRSVRRMGAAQLHSLILQFGGVPEDWEDTESQPSKSKIEIIRGLLFVNQPPHIQRDVENLLRRIRSAETAHPASGPFTGQDAREQTLQARLSLPRTISAQRMKLSELVGWLTHNFELPMRVDAQYHDDAQIELRSDGQSLEQALQRALRPLGLAILVEHEMVVIADEDYVSEHRPVWIYPARHVPPRVGNDGELERLARRAIARTLGRADPDDDVDEGVIAAAPGLLFVRASAELQRAVARELGFAGDPSRNIDARGLGRFAGILGERRDNSSDRSTRSRINP